MTVPGGMPAARTATIAPPSTMTSVAAVSVWRRVRSVKRDTDAIDGKASPRNPSVAMASRSSLLAILLVAWRSTASSASAASIPTPSSSTRTRRLPPCSIVMATRVAPASMAFSTSSLTTLAGRSTTSPAAIWFASSGGRRWMTGIDNGREEVA